MCHAINKIKKANIESNFLKIIFGNDIVHPGGFQNRGPASSFIAKVHTK